MLFGTALVGFGLIASCLGHHGLVPVVLQVVVPLESLLDLGNGGLDLLVRLHDLVELQLQEFLVGLLTVFATLLDSATPSTEAIVAEDGMGSANSGDVVARTVTRVSSGLHLFALALDVSELVLQFLITLFDLFE